VPKANTPFQWQPFAGVEAIATRLRKFTAELRGLDVQVRSESPQWSLLQAIYSRGDERVGRALAGARDLGRLGQLRALREAGVDIEVATGPLAVGQALPWDAIESGLPAGYLERRGSLEAE
jgi:hypothetical protein